MLIQVNVAFASLMMKMAHLLLLLLCILSITGVV